MLTYPHFKPHFPRDQWLLNMVIEYQASHRPDAPFLSWGDGGAPYSFAQTNVLVNRLAHGLVRIGVGKSERVVLFLPNCLEFVFAWFALAKCGAVEVAIGDTSKGSFLEHQLGLSRPRVVITTPELAQHLVALEQSVPTLSTCVVVSTERSRQASPKFARIQTIPFDELLTQQTVNPQAAVRPGDPASILFTSGTTGPSKGVVMSHSQLYFFSEQDCQLTGLTPDDVYMTGFPLSHGNAQVLTVYPCLIAGAHCVLYPKFSGSDFIGRARRSRATVANLIGATTAFVCAQPPAPQDRDHNLRCIYAAPLAPDLAPVFTQRFGVDCFVNGFGQTEISLPFMTPPGLQAPPGASGVLVDQWFEVQLVDPETDEPVAEGSSGELLIRPKAPGVICSEYLGMPEKTVETWRNLWFHTGDILRRDAEGWYYFVDRVKDAMRRRGENVSSFEVEAVVRSHPAVAECAVVAVKADETGGEDEIKACIVLVEGQQLRCEALMEWCDTRMPSYMVPRYVEVMGRLPQTPSEKVRKQELRARGVTKETWDRVRAGFRLAKERRSE
jgi:crotonobetaine/carnitine-CoA ligase